MSTFFGIGSDSVGSLFSSTSSSGTAGILSDYYSIRNGSYKKLLTAYYSLDNSSTGSSKTTTKTTTSTASDSTKTLSSIKSSTDSLKDSTDALLKTGTKSLFSKTGEYDTKAIYNAVKSFVDDYNDVIESTETSNTKGIASNSASMITTTKANANLLSKIGITIGTDGTLSLDEKEFKAADMNKVKSLFNGAGSYGYQISAKASMINYYASTEASKANTYTNAGSYSYNYSSGDLLNKLY